MRIPLKTFINRRNNQANVTLPRKIMTKMPDRVNLDIPDKYIKKSFLRENIKWK